MRKNKILAMIMIAALACTSFSVFAAAAEDENPSKEETVYVLTDAQGTVDRIIVSDRFDDVSAEDAKDYMTGLKDVENVKGDEYWQGTSYKDHELPVTMKVTYTLGGNEVKPEDLAGKSGHLVIRYEFTNNMKKKVTVNDKQETLYIPFIALTGMILDQECFENIEVTNGKAVSNGDRTIVLGYAFPGLKQDLTIDLTEENLTGDEQTEEPEDTSSLNEEITEKLEEMEIPEYFEIEADVTNLELGCTYTIISNSLLNAIDTDSLDEQAGLSGVEEDMDEITDAMSQILEGAGDLYDGICDLSDGADDLSEGVNTLAEGLDTLDTSGTDLMDGAGQVFDALLAAASSQIASSGLEAEELTRENYVTVLDDLVTYLDGAEELAQQEAYAQVSDAVNARESEIRSAVTAAVQEEVTTQVTAAVQQEVSAQVTEGARQQVLGQVLSYQGMDPDSYQLALENGMVGEEQSAAIEAAVEEQMDSGEVQALIQANTEEQMGSEEVQALITSNVDTQMQAEEVIATIEEHVQEQAASLIEENYNSEDVQAQIQEAVAQAQNGSEQISALKEQLSGYQEFYDGLSEYTQGVTTAADGASTLNESMPDLTEGISALKDGSKELADGLDAFNEEGIQQLTGFFDNSLAKIKDRMKAVADLSGTYTSFLENEDGLQSSVRFLYKTEEISND